MLARLPQSMAISLHKWTKNILGLLESEKGGMGGSIRCDLHSAWLPRPALPFPKSDVTSSSSGSTTVPHLSPCGVGEDSRCGITCHLPDLYFCHLGRKVDFSGGTYHPLRWQGCLSGRKMVKAMYMLPQAITAPREPFQFDKSTDTLNVRGNGQSWKMRSWL